MPFCGSTHGFSINGSWEQHHNAKKGDQIMTTSRKTLRTSLAAALLLAGVTTIAQGQTGGGLGSFGGGTRGLIQIKGSVICTGCSLNEVREAQPQERKLHQLSCNHGQVVM
jgi:hypothetical protein